MNSNNNETVTFPAQEFKKILGRIDLVGMSLTERMIELRLKDQDTANAIFLLGFIHAQMREMSGIDYDAADALDMAKSGQTTAERMISEL